LVAAIGLLGDCLWGARGLEAIFGNGDVGAVGAAGDLAAVDAVAERLGEQMR